jgi:cyanate permease
MKVNVFHHSQSHSQSRVRKSAQTWLQCLSAAFTSHLSALSGFAQGLGYLLASAGPLLIGLLHSVTGSWTVPVVILLGVSGGQFVAGLLASRDKTISAADLDPAPALS